MFLSFLIFWCQFPTQPDPHAFPISLLVDLNLDPNNHWKYQMYIIVGKGLNGGPVVFIHQTLSEKVMTNLS